MSLFNSRTAVSMAACTSHLQSGSTSIRPLFSKASRNAISWLDQSHTKTVQATISFGTAGSSLALLDFKAGMFSLSRSGLKISERGIGTAFPQSTRYFRATCEIFRSLLCRSTTSWNLPSRTPSQSCRESCGGDGGAVNFMPSSPFAAAGLASTTMGAGSSPWPPATFPSGSLDCALDIFFSSSAAASP